MSTVTLVKASFGNYDVLGWDEYNGKDDLFIGQLTNPDGHYYFEAYESSPLLCHKVMLDIACEISRLNKELAA